MGPANTSGESKAAAGTAARVGNGGSADGGFGVGNGVPVGVPVEVPVGAGDGAAATGAGVPPKGTESANGEPLPPMGRANEGAPPPIGIWN